MHRTMLAVFPLVALLLGCSHTARNPVPVALEPLPFSPSKSAAQFNQIQIDGQIQVNLKTACKQSSVQIHGDPRDLAYLRNLVVDERLILSLGKGYPRFGPVSAAICSHSLRLFKYHGAGQINGQHIQSNGLDLIIYNQGSTTLTGNMVLRSLELGGRGLVKIHDVRGSNLAVKIRGKVKLQLGGVIDIATLSLKNNAVVSLYWLKSYNLFIRARGNSYIQFAGIANRLNLELWNNAHFNGRYLRVNRVFAKTHDNAVADIAAVNRQSTLAKDQSNIYFYNIPEMKADFMANDGSVLDMRDWNMPFMQEYDRYNK